MSKHAITFEENEVVKLNSKTRDPLRGLVVAGAEFRVSGYVDELSDGKSWRELKGNWAAVHYDARMKAVGLPDDNEVLYGHIAQNGINLGHMVHVTEIEQEGPS